MNIALLAHDNKQELMAQFCFTYRWTLYIHNLFAPATIGKLINSVTDIPVTALMLPCCNGGSEQIGAKIAFKEIDLVLFFCDPSGKTSTRDVEAISRLCDAYGVPYATNIATAEALILALGRGNIPQISRRDYLRLPSEDPKMLSFTLL